MLIDYVNGQTSVILRVKIRNSSVSTAAGLTGLSSASSGLVIATIADNEATKTAYTQAGSTIESITTLGTFATPTATKCRFKEVDPTYHPGVYEIQLDNSRFAVSSAKSLLVSISGATNAVECDAVIPLRAVNPYSAATFMTGVNGLAPPTNWNLQAIDGSGRVLLQPTQTGVTIPTVTTLTNITTANVTQWAGNAVAATRVNGVPIVDIGYVVGNAAAVSSGTAQAGANGSITLASSEPATNGFYVGRQVTIVAGTAVGQARFITAYNGSTKVATVHRNWDVNPDVTSQYSIDGLNETNVYQFAGQSAVLDANNLPNVNAKDWNGTAITTSTPNTASVAVTAISAGIAAADVWGAARAGFTTAGTFGQAVAAVNANVTVGGYAASQDPGTYVLSTAANKLATDSTGRVLLQPTQSGVTIPTVTAVTTANLNLSQVVPTSNTAQTVGDALNAARAQGFGKWQLVGTTLTLYAPDGSTAVRTFSLDSVSAPTVRT